MTIYVENPAITPRDLKELKSNSFKVESLLQGLYTSALLTEGPSHDHACYANPDSRTDNQ